jgi:hypothetical protein
MGDFSMMGSMGHSTSFSMTGQPNQTTMFAGLFPEEETSLLTYYKDIYHNDHVSGSAIDLISTMPFSDFTLTGCKDKERTKKYEQAIERLSLRTCLPEISVDYLVTGAFIASLIFNKDTRCFTDMIPYDRSLAKITPLPLYGIDPVIEISGDKTLNDFLKSDDPRVGAIRRRLSPALLEGLGSQRFRLDPVSVLYIPRRTFTTNATGTSFLRRVLPVYFLEKILYRGTIVEAMKRQRSLLHLQVGDEIWEPTPDDLMHIVNVFRESEADPLGGIIATRNAVNPNEYRQGGDFWKWTDIVDITNALKLRALGISESFLSGESSFATAEVNLSVFLENISSYRARVTHATFYSRLFPIIALTNNFFKDDKDRIKEEDVLKTMSKTDMLIHLADTTKFDMPRLNWHKSLRPKNDQSTMDTLKGLQDYGIPPPIRRLCAAAGLGLEELLTELREEQNDGLRDELKKFAGAPEGQGDSEGSDGAFASLLQLAKQQAKVRRGRKPLLARKFEGAEIRGKTKTGKDKAIYNQKAAQDKADEDTVKALQSLSQPGRMADVLAKIDGECGGIPDVLGLRNG